MAITWQTKLKTASFRNIRFNYQADEAKFGRRTVDHEFPKREEGYQEDLGKKSQTFQIEAFVQGFDYMRLRDNLIKACETPGPGILVHPYYGKKNVVCEGCEVKQSTGDGGVARFTLTFKEAGKLLFPNTSSTNASKLGVFAQALKDASDAAFAAVFTVTNSVQFVVNQAEAAVNDVTNALAPITNGVTQLSDKISDFASSVNDLKIDTIALIQTPILLAARMSAAIGQVTDLSLSSNEVFGAYKSLFGFSTTHATAIITTPSNQLAQDNASAVEQLVRIQAISNAAVAATTMTFDSLDDANQTKQDLYDAIDILSLSSIDDATYLALGDLRAQVENTIPPEGLNLPSIVTISLPESLPSLVLSYQLYQGLDEEADILARNKISNPAFLPGGISLEVLSG